MNAGREHGGATVRQAVVIGVSKFPASALDSEVPAPGESRFDGLPFVPQRVAALIAQLQVSGYDVCSLSEPDHTQMSQAVDACIADQSATCKIIHMISHGSPGKSVGRVDAVPADGVVRLAGTNVVSWISDAFEGSQPTLFLIDLCFAGRAVNHDWLNEVTTQERVAHVIAAAPMGRSAYNGNFTEAVATVVKWCGEDGLGTDSSCRYIDLAEFTRRVQDETARLSAQEQLVTHTPMGGAREAGLPFFENPNFPKNRPLDRLRPAVDPDLLAFSDDPTTGAHFWVDRVGRHFSGRAAELDRLMPWIRRRTGGPALIVVTGGPGSGKSTLLGAIVCASHPMLHAADEVARSAGSDRPGIIRAAGSYEPELIAPFAAVHARQRRLHDVVASIGRQLGLAEPDGGWSAPGLIDAISRMSQPPSIVVDALDESTEPENVEAVLLLPLARCLEALGGRLLVGVRPWREDFRGLFDTVSGSDAEIDLDDVPPEVLRVDLERFVRRLLADSRRFAGPGKSDEQEELAEGIARCLAQLGSGPEKSGAFLVAALYARHIGDGAPRGEPPTVRQLVAEVPLSLPEVLELDLRGQDDVRELRVTLAVLADAKGEGMPWAQVCDTLSTFDFEPDSKGPSPDLQFYLRTSVDVGKTTLYRLFHQSLVDHLRKFPLRPPNEEAP